jgi:hypothetical protein
MLKKIIKKILNEDFDWFDDVSDRPFNFQDFSIGDVCYVVKHPDPEYLEYTTQEACGDIDISSFSVGNRVTIIDIDKLLRGAVDCDASFNNYESDEVILTLLLRDEITGDLFWVSEEMVELSFYTPITESDETKWIDDIKTIKYRFFDVYVCDGHYIDDDGCADGYSIYLKLPEKDLIGIWSGGVDDVLEGGMISRFKDFLYKNKLIQPYEYDIIEHIQEISYDEFIEMTDGEYDEFGEYGYEVNESDDFEWLESVDGDSFKLSDLMVGDVVIPTCIKQEKFTVTNIYGSGVISDDNYFIQRSVEMTRLSSGGNTGVVFRSHTPIGDNCLFKLIHRKPENLNLKD